MLVALDDGAGGLTACDGERAGCQGPGAGLEKLWSGLGVVLDGKHQPHHGGMPGCETNVGARQLEQSRVKVEIPIGHGASESASEAIEALDSESIQQDLFGGEVATRRRVAHADLAAEFPQGQVFDSVTFDGSLRGLEKGGAKISVVVGPFRFVHDCSVTSDPGTQQDAALYCAHCIHSLQWVH